MDAYVTMKGKPSARYVTREAIPGAYAGLVFGHPDGSSTRLEVTYAIGRDGERIVEVSRTNPGQDTTLLLREVVAP